MRILFWTELFWPAIGGAQSFARDLLLGLHGPDYEFAVVTRWDNLEVADQVEFEGIPVHRFSFANKNIRQRMAVRQRVRQLKRSFAPDLIHINLLGVSTFFHLETAQAPHPAPCLFTVHGEYQQPAGEHSLFGQTLRSVDWISTPSAATLTYIRRMVPDITARSSYIYNGIDPPPLSPTPLPFDAPRLLCLGRLSGEKGFSVALKAFASIVDRFPHARLIIAGDGPERSALEQEAADLGLLGKVDFIGWVAPQEVPALLNTVTLVVMPSQQEALPFVALETASMARPIVATRVGGVPEVVVHGKTGLLVDEGHPDSVARAVCFLLEHPEEATQMGETARRHVQQAFRQEQCFEGYRTLYQKLI